MITTNGGATWTVQPSGVNQDLFAVDFYAVDSGIAVGNNGVMLRTTNAGLTWTVVPPVTTANLRGISFSSPAVGTVVGLNGSVFRTTNTGLTWTALRGVVGQLYEVDFVNDTVGTVVGGAGLIMRTTDGGASWTQQASGTGVALLGVSFSDENHGTIVGNSGRIIRTTNGGATWVQQSAGTSVNLTSVQMITNSLGYVVGDGGTIRRTTNGGASWVPQASGTTAHLREVSFSDPMHGTVVGTGGTILRTTTGGQIIQVQRSYNVHEGWNLISVPLTVENFSKNVLYPTSSSDAYSFAPGAGYEIQNTLQNGPGYWLKFDANESIPMLGFERFRDTINVVEGWNIIGSISLPVPIASIVTIPAGIIDGSIYGYNNGYFTASTIDPGKGYWVKVTQSGKIILSAYTSPDGVPADPHKLTTE